MMLDGAEECELSGPIGELVPFTTDPPNLSPPTVSEPTSSAVCVQPDAAWVNTYTRPALLT